MEVLLFHCANFHRTLNKYAFLVVLGLHCWVGFSLAAASRGYSLVAVEGFLTVVASLILEHGLQGAGSAVVHGLSCPDAGGIFPEQGLNRRSLHCKVDS